MIKNSFKNLYLTFYKKKLRKKHKLKIGHKVYINRVTTFGGRNYLSNYATLKDSHIGFASYLGERTVIRKTKIGKYTSIGPDVKCIFGKHPSHTFASTHPAFFSTLKQAGFSFTDKQLFEEYEAPINSDAKYQIEIGSDVWIGANVSIMDGITIGNGAIIAANALVTKDVPPYAIMGGLPAKVIKYRFNKDEIEFLNNLQWWNKNYEWVKKNAHLFCNISRLMEEFS